MIKHWRKNGCIELTSFCTRLTMPLTMFWFLVIRGLLSMDSLRQIEIPLRPCNSSSSVESFTVSPCMDILWSIVFQTQPFSGCKSGKFERFLASFVRFSKNASNETAFFFKSASPIFKCRRNPSKRWQSAKASSALWIWNFHSGVVRYFFANVSSLATLPSRSKGTVSVNPYQIFINSLSKLCFSTTSIFLEHRN